MIVYFADRQLNIIGQASTELPQGLIVTADRKTEDIETGVAVFECRIPFDKATRALVEECTEVGNYILRSHDNENEFYTIIDAEIDTKKQEIYIYAEDDGMDLLNEVVGAYEADQAYPISHYINKYAAGAGFEIGINEAKELTRKLSWEGESTATERIASIATQFDGCEVSYSFDVDGLTVTRKYINIYRERGKDVGATLRLNHDIDSIVTTKSIANLATALQCVGGTPEDDNYEDDVEPTAITLEGYSYDDGDFYVDGVLLKSREALKKWSRYLWKNDDTQKVGGHIVKPYSYDTISQQELCSRAITELKKIRDMEVNYEVDITKFPDNVKIGDRINIVDDAGELYVSARVLQLETSVADQEYKATLGEYLIKSSGISQKVADLAAQFAKSSQSAARALELAKTARDAAESAQSQVDAAVKSVEEAQKAVEEVADVVEEAKQSAANAQTAASNAQAVVDSVEEKIVSLEQTIETAQAAADNAYIAAETAQAKAEEAEQAAADAQADAETALAESSKAVTAANSASTNASTAITNANAANIAAKNAQTTADAAKADAANAQKDIDALGEDLDTMSNTMSADYARKTDLTETTASLQSQISQNAAQIKLNVSSLTIIDETANNAQAQAQAAQDAAATAQAQADQATADAKTAQDAATAAADAASAAQSEADRAKAAADTAKGVADKAEADLAAAQADLATVSSRVDATEEEIVAAQQAVQTAQEAADKAKGDADAAAKKAADAQSTADTAVDNAAAAKEAADDAADKAGRAQQTADEAKGDAAAAQSKANEAADAAAAAQTTANQAVTNAANAKAAADQAAAEAQAAQQAADDADSKAAQAASDLATAKQNLANVTSRVDATEEEVAAAQAAVVTAQAAADKAKADAATAQSTANTAKANAANAQAAADKAQADAEKAQKAADDAQKAADDAMDAVGKLAVRVTDAETWMEETDEYIATCATKKEVSQTLSGYYTAEQTEGRITTKAGEITSTVKKDIREIEVGGRNLLFNSKTLSGDNIGGTGTIDAEKYNGLSIRRYDNSAATNYSDMLRFTGIYPEKLGDVYTLSFYAKGSGNIATFFYGATGYLTVAKSVQPGNPDDIVTTSGDGHTPWTLTDNWQRYWVTWTLASNGDISIEKYVLFRAFAGSVANICGVKLEKGNKATTWSPAPEDVDTDIGTVQALAEDAQSRVESAESSITQLADAIEMLVTDSNGASLMTQTADGWTFNIGEITSKLNDTAEDVDGLNADVSNAKTAIDGLNKALDDLGVIADYVIITTYNGQPCIELGEGDNNFKLRITNTEIQFADGTTIPAYVSNKKLMIEQAEVKDELQFGGFIWKSRSNGNIGLMWKGVSS